MIHSQALTGSGWWRRSEIDNSVHFKEH